MKVKKFMLPILVKFFVILILTIGTANCLLLDNQLSKPEKDNKKSSLGLLSLVLVNGMGYKLVNVEIDVEFFDEGGKQIENITLTDDPAATSYILGKTVLSDFARAVSGQPVVTKTTPTASGSHILDAQFYFPDDGKDQNRVQKSTRSIGAIFGFIAGTISTIVRVATQSDVSNVVNSQGDPSNPIHIGNYWMATCISGGVSQQDVKFISDSITGKMTSNIVSATNKDTGESITVNPDPGELGQPTIVKGFEGNFISPPDSVDVYHSYGTRFKTNYNQEARLPIMIYYTIDGSTPSCAGTVTRPAPDCIQKCTGTADFCKAFCVSHRIPARGDSIYSIKDGPYIKEPTTMKAVSCLSTYSSKVSSLVFDFKAPKPYLERSFLTDTTNLTIKAASILKDVTIYYTLDGSVPTTSSTKYVGPFPVASPSTGTVKAIATKTGYLNSDVMSSTYLLPAFYSIGGTISGLSGTVVIKSNLDESLTITTNGSFQFTKKYMQGTGYTVFVTTQPSGQNCTVTNRYELISSDVTNIAISCSDLVSIGGGSGSSNGTTATRVYGQGGSFTSNTANNGGVSANSLSFPWGLARDSSGGLYVSDSGNNRVLYIPSGSTTATRVYGQGGSFTSSILNNGGISANSLNYPRGLAVDSSGGLYVADYNNNRVLFYPSGSTTATRVYGQNGSFTTAISASATADTLGQPSSVAVDSSGGVYINSSNRVLYYTSGSTTATRVYGQGGSFTTNTSNMGGISADSLNQTSAVTLDATGDLYIADNYNFRVLFYPSGSTTATRVYGQNGNFTTAVSSPPTTFANGGPLQLGTDSSGGLYALDAANHRVFFFPSGSTTATRVYGQAGSFNSGIENNGGISADSLRFPEGFAIDSDGRVYIADTGNNRILFY